MSGSQTLGGPSRAGRVIGPSLDKIIKNAAWRKHSHLVAACKAVLDRLETVLSDDVSDPSSPLLGFPLPDAEFVIQPLILALETASAKVIEPALDCAFKLFSFGLFRGEIDTPDAKSSPSSSKSVLFLLMDAMCRVSSLGEDAVELAVLRAFLAAVHSPFVMIRGDFLVQIVRTCYNLYLSGVSGSNQICAKAVLAQIVVIVFTRVEEDSMNAGPIRPVAVAELLEFTDKNLSESNSLSYCQSFINEVIYGTERVVGDSIQVRFSSALEMQNGNHKESESEKEDTPTESVADSNLREDGFLLFKNLCKLSMKYSSPENTDDQILLRGKILSLELLKVIMANGGPIWLSNERFLNAIKQYLCLSLLKNSALSVMAVFQLLCSIFLNLVTKYRSGLKSEIGIFFPMLVLRVLENVLQPSYMQKMTILNLLEKIFQDSQLSIDVFVNYDCDVDAPNIFERTVNGLLKTALGPPPGSTTTLSSAQDITFRHESVKCLVTIIRSMGSWMDQQLRIGDSYPAKNSVSDISTENQLASNGEEGAISDFELPNEANTELSDAATLEQRRAYKIELQKGISLFNKKPTKGIEFLISTKKVGGSPEEVAAFLRNTSGLNETVIGDYLGERQDFSLKVMHAYVDSYSFEGMDFGEAIRFFLRGFRLPGEAQKIDRIMEKFAERYCKCNPSSFATADTAYVLAYSVILLNTDAHNNMVKDKMTKADFIKNNRGIDDGKDIPEDYLGALYDQIVKNEIKIIDESSAPQSKVPNNFNKLLGLDGILNLVSWKQTEEKAVGANGLLIRHIQEQFRAKSGKSESIYHAVTDPAILRFMVEVSWGPMLAAFSVTLDQSDDTVATDQCLLGFRYAVHVTAVLGLQTQKDAFVSSMAKFTFLHCAADMKQKNVDAVKAIILIAIEDGNYLQEAWEHILTCLSRIEHLQLLGEGSPSDASYLSAPTDDFDEKTAKSLGLSSLKQKGHLQNPAMMAVVRGGSYDSTGRGVNTSGQLSSVQISNFMSNLNLLEQIGNFELNQVFTNSQRLNSDAIVAFVRALCKVSILELQSPTDPRVFSLTKIVEIAHYNMDRIRLVWSRIWNVLSEFFVSVGLSENLSVAIFVMDSLRQLAIKFLEREELANYNFQNEFLRPFVIVMQKSNSTEIRELIVRCISQMVLSRVSNVKSGWKSVFMVFTTAAADERKNIVLLAFQTMEKIVREYFPYITETETMTFTDCVKCLLTFTHSRFNSDVSLNAIAFLRFCAVKLAEGGFVCNEEIRVDSSPISLANKFSSDIYAFTEKDDHMSFWVPLLTGLSKLASEPRPAIRKTSVEVLFDILKDHGHLFSCPFWVGVFNSVIFPIFNLSKKIDLKDGESRPVSSQSEANTWDSETSAVASDCLIDLFVRHFDAVRSQLPNVVSVVTGFIRNDQLGAANTGVNALVRLTGGLGHRFSEDEWRYIFLALKQASESTLLGFMEVLSIMDTIEVPDSCQSNTDTDMMSDLELTTAYLENDNLQTAAYVVGRTKSHISVQLLIIQAVTDLWKANMDSLSADNIKIILKILSSVASHATQLNSETILQKKLQKVCSILELSGPPIVHFENDSHQNFLNFLQDLPTGNPAIAEKIGIESLTVDLCEKILKIYLNCTADQSEQQQISQQRWVLPLPVTKKEELAARTPLAVSALQVLCGMERDSFRRYVPHFFPLLVALVRCEHTSGDFQLVLSNMFKSCIGPIVLS